MPTQNLAEFVLYIAPGYIAIRILRWIIPVKDKDTFHDIASSVVLGVAIISLLQWLDKELPFLRLSINTNSLPGMRFLLAILISGVVTGFLLVCLKKLINRISRKVRKLNWISSGIDMVWVRINDRDNQNWAVVHLDDGSIYTGWISRYTYNPNFQDQDFLLSEAIKVDEYFDTIYKINGIGVYLNTRDVKRIEFLEYSETDE